MNKITLTDKLCSLREKSGMTQEEVANHLGITKAAVSKWECNQSYPDITLLPMIAELYGVSIDDLFEHNTDLEQVEIDVIYQRTLELFKGDYTDALSFVEEQAKDHWSSEFLLQALAMAVYSQLPLQQGFGAENAEGAAYECAAMADKLFKRVLQLGDAVHSSILAPYTCVLQLLGKSDEALEMLEPLMKSEPNQAPLSIANIYFMQGKSDEALEVIQRAGLLSLVEALSCIATIPAFTADFKLIDAAVDYAEHIQYDQQYVALNPTMLPTMLYAAAKVAVTDCDENKTLNYLERFVPALRRCLQAIESPVNPMLFNGAIDLMWSDADQAVNEQRSAARASLKQTYMQELKNNELWNGLRGKEKFIELLAEIEEM